MMEAGKAHSNSGGEYRKIHTIYKRDNRGRLLESQYACPEFAYLAKACWAFEEKVDGTNIRILFDGSTVEFRGRTDAAVIQTVLQARLLELFPLVNFIKVFCMTQSPRQVCLYGEGYGAGIQAGGGKYKPHGVDFVLFDVWIDGWWLDRQHVEQIALALGIRSVPLVGYGTLQEAVALVQEGLISRWGGFQAEGLILRPTVQLFTRHGERIISKIKHKDFVRR